MGKKDCSHYLINFPPEEPLLLLKNVIDNLSFCSEKDLGKNNKDLKWMNLFRKKILMIYLNEMRENFNRI